MGDDKSALREPLLPQSQGDVEIPLAVVRRQKRRHRARKLIAFLSLTFLGVWLLKTSALSGSCLSRFWGGGRDHGHHEHGRHGHHGHNDSRRTRISVGSEKTEGDFDLYDLLAIRSGSGSVDIVVHPQPAANETRKGRHGHARREEPAELTIHAFSGSVAVEMLAADDTPARDYRVSIRTGSGDVRAALLHGHSTTVQTGSATIALELTPVLFGGEKKSWSNEDDEDSEDRDGHRHRFESTLNTVSGSGAQDITVRSPLGGNATFEGLLSRHSSGSAPLTLRYPREWSGVIEGHTGTGEIRIHDDGVEMVDAEDSGSAGHYVRTNRGNGSSVLRFHTGSGKVDLYFE